MKTTQSLTAYPPHTSGTTRDGIFADAVMVNLISEEGPRIFDHFPLQNEAAQ
jgi:hypothetical protein